MFRTLEDRAPSAPTPLVVTIGDKSFRGTIGEWHFCKSNDDCVTAFAQPETRCVECPTECGQNTESRACFWFNPDPPMETFRPA